MKEVALFDIDQTIYNGYSTFPLSQAQFEANLIDKITVETLNQDMADYKTGKLDYEATVAALLNHWANGLQGVKYLEILTHTRQFFYNQSGQFFPYVTTVITKLRPTHDIFFVTGEPQFIAEAVSGQYQATGWLSSVFELNEQGMYTGEVEKYLATKSQKKQALSGLVNTHSFQNSYGFGDSEADIEMLSLVNKAICINPSPALLAHATQQNWTIATPDNVLSFVGNGK